MTEQERQSESSLTVSPKPRPAWLDFLSRWRTATTLGLFIAIVVVGAALRPAWLSARIPSGFWVKKLEWRHNADMVLAGDSRIYAGLSPQAMNEALPNQRILNFGFSAAGYTPKFLESIERVLDPKSSNPAIVLGIDPQSLTPASQRTNGFIVIDKYRAVDRAEAVYLEDFNEWVRPTTLGELVRVAMGRYRTTHRVLHDDGWVATDTDVLAPNSWSKQSAAMFIDNQVSEDVINRLMAAIKRWTEGERLNGPQDGTHTKIKVYAFRPPNCAASVAFENANSGYDEAAIKRRVTEAGGTWIDIPKDGWKSFDGSHLVSASAVRLSKMLAGKIAAIEKRGD